MRAFLSHDTALQYWRYHFPLDGELGKPTTISHAETCANRKDDLLGYIPETFRAEDRPTDVMVFDSRHRIWTDVFACHIWTTSIPSNAFYRVHDMCISSPEFVFLQMASTLTLAQLIALGCELCGTYVLLPRARRLLDIPDDAPRRAAPLTDPEKLNTFLENARGAKHLAKARRALRYIAEGARSPMEAATYMLLCLPVMLGGYGLPCPEINPSIPLDEEGKRIANRGWCEGDLCWIDAKLDVEYNGAVHSGSAKMRDDAGRILGIEHMGWKVITITSDQVFDIDKFETVVAEIAKRLKYRLRPQTLGHLGARTILHEELEAWMEADGRP